VSAPNARLLSVKNASRYLGVSTWVTWRLIKTGVLTTVVIPGVGEKGDVQRILVDREDLDRLIPQWKPRR
jgi:imidazoleglycerol phosphate synthase glutamine amidotransferase subunit HisH